ncbi:MAG: hypothetical protein WA383_01480 [Terriglobales bacterium]|jgi:hypothetical protein
MPQIPYSATNFSGAFTHLNGNGQISVAWAQLVWAAITVGKAAGDEYAYGIYSALERLHRASMMRAYLLEASSGLLLQTMPYVASDPSEKTSISFYIGMTLAKLFAEALFNVPRMLHFAVYGQNYQIAAGQGASRPDLIGLSASGNWFVFEAKGRSNGFDSGALVTAKDQAEQINLIDNVAPLCRIASQSFFSTNGLRFRMDDPQRSRSNRPRTLDITRNDFEHAYYDPIRAIVESRGSITQLAVARRTFRGAQIKELDCWIALAEQDVSLTDQSEPNSPFSSEYIGNDGVLVRLGSSWSEANMRLQPHLRLV